MRASHHNPTSAQSGAPDGCPVARDVSWPGELVISGERHADVLVLSLRGELDVASSAVLERELHAAEATRPQRLAIDLGGLDFIACSGLSTLLLANQRAGANGHRLSLRHGQPAVKRVFELTNTLHLFSSGQ